MKETPAPQQRLLELFDKVERERGANVNLYDKARRTRKINIYANEVKFDWNGKRKSGELDSFVRRGDGFL